MKKIEEYTPCELVTLSTIVGVLIAAQTQSIKSQQENQGGDNGDGNSKGDNKDLQKQIDEIKRYVEDLESGRSC